MAQQWDFLLPPMPPYGYKWQFFLRPNEDAMALPPALHQGHTGVVRALLDLERRKWSFPRKGALFVQSHRRYDVDEEVMTDVPIPRITAPRDRRLNEATVVPSAHPIPLRLSFAAYPGTENKAQLRPKVAGVAKPRATRGTVSLDGEVANDGTMWDFKQGGGDVVPFKDSVNRRTSLLRAKTSRQPRDNERFLGRAINNNSNLVALVRSETMPKRDVPGTDDQCSGTCLWSTATGTPRRRPGEHAWGEGSILFGKKIEKKVTILPENKGREDVMVIVERFKSRGSRN
ncbi:hypothetical protein F5148DRAFT_1151699 [Russula earlei]|uniref:Uncharacterized protein n=1 Tax=Russula earlei TaxID=71964 RepID=A0ACC0U0N9_9AGAM|nr:hypothetical protein F5148DRAFT_1151699 [Russula earlei]